MTYNNRYTTLSEATRALIKNGFTENFRISADGYLLGENGNKFRPDEVQLCEFHRFEGMTNPSDMSILYALKTNRGTQGLIIDSYGPQNSAITADFMKSIPENL